MLCLNFFIFTFFTSLHMFLLHLATLLAKQHAHSGQTRFLENLSLIPPHVGSNGREDYFEFENHFFVKTKTRRDFTQLGYKEPNTFGMVKTKENFKFKDMDVSFEFGLQDLQKGGKHAGFGFWLTEKADNKAEFYGGSNQFNGCGVVIDIQGTPYAKFVDSSNNFHKGVPIPVSDNEIFRIVFSNRAKKFNVKLFISDKEHLLYEGPVAMPEKVFLSATSFSGLSKSTLRLERIFSQSFSAPIKKLSVRGERKGRNGFIYLIGVCSIVGLGYYLFHKEQKEFIMKN